MGVCRACRWEGGYSLTDRPCRPFASVSLPILSSLFIHPAAKFGSPEPDFAPIQNHAHGRTVKGRRGKFFGDGASVRSGLCRPEKFSSESEKFFVGAGAAVGCGWLPARQKNFRVPLTEARRVVFSRRKSGGGSRMRRVWIRDGACRSPLSSPRRARIYPFRPVKAPFKFSRNAAFRVCVSAGVACA